MIERWLKLENMAMNKESRVIDNRRIWENFTIELKGFEAWAQKALQDYSIESCSEADIEKLVILLQKHKVIIILHWCLLLILDLFLYSFI